MEASDSARRTDTPAFVFAMSQPDEVDVNEILFCPTGQEY
jgi:hypothetical protein